jgi:hypothetical protein
MARTVTLTATVSKDVIKKFLVSVCGFTADAAKEITKNRDMMTWMSSTYSKTRGSIPSDPL